MSSGVIEENGLLLHLSHGLGKLDDGTNGEYFAATKTKNHAGGNNPWPNGAFSPPKRRHQECGAQTKLVRSAPKGSLCHRADCFRTVSLGKAGTFHANELIGDPFGLAYEIAGQKLSKLPPRTIQELGT